MFSIAESHVRVVLMLGAGQDVRTLLLVAHTLGMTGLGWAYLGFGMDPTAAYGLTLS